MVTNLETDFTSGGPLAHPGADEAAPALVADVAREIHARDPYGVPSAAPYGGVTSSSKAICGDLTQ